MEVVVNYPYLGVLVLLVKGIVEAMLGLLLKVVVEEVVKADREEMRSNTPPQDLAVLVFVLLINLLTLRTMSVVVS